MRYFALSLMIGKSCIFKQLFFCKERVDIARKVFERIRRRDFRDEEHAARFNLISATRKRLAQKPLDSVSFNALSILFSHTHRKTRFLCRKIHERYRLRKRSLSGFINFFDFLVFFQTETTFRHFCYAETCFLPLFLRRLITFLPPVVFMRFLKPCTLLLCLFLC